MNKLFLLLIMLSVNSYAADFAPTPMTITVQPQVEYKFDGSPLEIPFTLTGKSGAIWLVINTHGQAENIVGVRNGYLGWHYVNKIDTTIYISDRFERQPGENTLVWDGRDENGNIPEPGTYDYYLWGYDDKSDRELACNFFPPSFNKFSDGTKLYEYDENGMPLSKPFLFGNQDAFEDWSETISHRRAGTHFKWFIGNNPNDVSLLQTTICSIYYPMKHSAIPVGDGKYDGNPEWVSYGGAVLDPNNFNDFYHTTFKNMTVELSGKSYYYAYYSVYKWNFVSNGEAVRYQDWFGWEKGTWRSHGYFSFASCSTDNKYIYINSPSYFQSSIVEWNKIESMSFDGELIYDKMMHDWYMPDQLLIAGDVNCSIDKLYTRMPKTFFLIGSRCCMHQLINTSRLLDDPDDETDMVVFTNSNGDYFMDNGWDPTGEKPWYCTFSARMNFKDFLERYSVGIDNNNFNIIFIGNYGISSFGVSTQDGTGLGYMSFADDVVPMDTWSNSGGKICDNGSLYDGLYVGKTPTVGSWFGDKTSYSTYYVAFDSAHGLITNNPAVETQNLLQFKVDQNIPNPFNPSTTISFSIPEKSNVSVDIYNIMGQKIKTLINGPMSAGEHSVKWDANGCSAGVYFYKVKAGKYEKTMRMTLVR